MSRSVYVAPMHRSAEHDAPADKSVPLRAAYDVPEVAQLLGGVGERYIWQLLATGELESFKIGRRRLVAKEQIDAFIARLSEDNQRAREAATRIAS